MREMNIIYTKIMIDDKDEYNKYKHIWLMREIHKVDTNIMMAKKDEWSRDEDNNLRWR